MKNNEPHGMSVWIKERIKSAEDHIRGAFERVEEISEYNQNKVLEAFKQNELSARHFSQTTGYGYDDIGRDMLDRVFACVFGAEDALVRPHIVSGTHALSLCIHALVEPGKGMISVTGKPYDTLEESIGIRGQKRGSLVSKGSYYSQIEFNGTLDAARTLESMNESTRLLYIQRSRGYSERRGLSPVEMQAFAERIKDVYPNAVILVDNCYGEFVNIEEPTDCGIDIIAGSLIKNPGGGIAPTGGYICGREDLVELCAERFTSPGIGKETGSYAASYEPFFKGLFFAPHVVGQSLKGAMLFASVFNSLGYDSFPKPLEERNDIIQSIALGKEAHVLAFCRGIQSASPVDSHVTPVPWSMPGYDSDVIMAAGTFIQGASIELSADAPIKPPYNVYFQGGLTYAHCKAGLIKVLQEMEKEDMINTSV